MLNRIADTGQTCTSSRSRAKATAILAASVALTLVSVSGAKAADNDSEMVFDGGKNYESCLIHGGTFKETPTTYSCTINGKTTTCDKHPDDKDAACSTETAGRLSNGIFGRVKFMGATIVAPNNSAASNRTIRRVKLR